MWKIKSFKNFWRDDLQTIFKKWNIDLSVQEVLERWQEPQRFYHNQDHLFDLLSEIEKLNIDENDWEKLVLVAIFHDIVYFPTRNDNEERSAEFFLSRCLDQKKPEIKEIYDAILDTKNHQSRSKLSYQFNKLDMMVVESDWPKLFDWELGIQKEYLNFYTIKEYKQGRLNFLHKLLDEYPHNRGNLQKLIGYVSEL